MRVCRKSDDGNEGERQADRGAEHELIHFKLAAIM